MQQQLIETWHINNRVNLKLLDALSAEALHCSLSKRGGGTPAKQFAHIHNVRVNRFEHHYQSLMAGQSKIGLAGEIGPGLLQRRLLESADAMAKWLAEALEDGGKVKGFRRGVIPMLGYLIAHESHHRGNILLTLKQCGHKLTKETTYGIWAWNQL